MEALEWLKYAKMVKQLADLKISYQYFVVLWLNTNGFIFHTLVFIFVVKI